ncbi:MAG: methionine biosynthesis protein MetW [Thermodesulfobacteriota bacterium]
MKPAINPLRYDLSIIASWIEPGSRVLDLGCGEGDLLHHLKTTKGVAGTGIEIREDKAAAALTRGLTVLQGDIRDEVADYAENSFDYVIVSQTLQQVLAPLELITSLLAIGRRVVVSFPNFSHWRNRLQFLVQGQAPRSPQLPYEWYDTPNIRVITIRDFRRFARIVGCSILRETAINTHQHDRSGNIVHFLPNLRATYGIFLIGRHPSERTTP